MGFEKNYLPGSVDQFAQKAWIRFIVGAAHLPKGRAVLLLCFAFVWFVLVFLGFFWFIREGMRYSNRYSNALCVCLCPPAFLFITDYIYYIFYN